MSEENVEIVRHGYDLVQRGQFEAMLSLLDPAIELKTSDLIADAGVYRGYDGTRQLFEMFNSDFGDFEIKPLRFREGPYGQVVADVELRGVGLASGFPFELRAFHVWTLRNGLAVRLVVFVDEKEALKAAGLSE